MWLYSAVSIDPRNALAVAHRVPSCPVKAPDVSEGFLDATSSADLFAST